MSFLRFLVLVASSVQILVGSYAAYRMATLAQPDLFGLLLCSTIIIAGLAGLSSLHIRPRPSVSRVSTIRLNAVLCAVLVVAAAVVIVVEYAEGVGATRIRLLTMMFAAFATPFVLNGIALSLIERRVKRLA